MYYNINYNINGVYSIVKSLDFCCNIDWKNKIKKLKMSSSENFINNKKDWKINNPIKDSPSWSHLSSFWFWNVVKKYHFDWWRQLESLGNIIKNESLRNIFDVYGHKEMMLFNHNAVLCFKHLYSGMCTHTE